MRAEDWKNFKTGGYKLFKEGHVQNIMVSQQGSIFGIKHNCLPEMKKDHEYKLEIDFATTGSDVCRAQCNCPAGRGLRGSCKHIAATLLFLKIFILLMKKFRHLPMIMMIPS